MSAIVALAIGAFAIYLLTGVVFRRPHVGSGACKYCHELRRLYRFGGSNICGRCYAEMDALI